jgi:hypothetical protein
MGGSQSSSSHSRKRQKPKPVIYRVKTNNVREEIEKSIKNNQLKKLYTVGGGPDPAKNCDKAFSSSYKCFPNGESRSVNYPADATGRTYEYNCTDEYNQCTGSKLILDDDGNLVLKNNNGEVLWESKTNRTGLILEKHSAKNGKYKRNFITSNEFLKVGEFIGSPSGNCILKLEKVKDKNGKTNLELQIQYMIIDCEKNGKMATENTYGEDGYVGNVNSYGVYEMSDGYINNQMANKILYIDGDMRKRQIPSNFKKLGNDFFDIGTYDSVGNNIKTIKNISYDKCKNECTSLENCHGVVYDKSKELCFIKNKNIFPNSARVLNTTKQLAIRKYDVGINTSCSSNVRKGYGNIMNRLPMGENMSKTTKCGLGLAISGNKKIIEEKEKALLKVINDITKELKSLSGEEGAIDDTMIKQVKKLEKDMKSYEVALKKIDSTTESYKNVVAMNEDSELNMLSSNTQNMLWTTLAAIIVLVSIKASR